MRMSRTGIKRLFYPTGCRDGTFGNKFVFSSDNRKKLKSCLISGGAEDCVTSCAAPALLAGLQSGHSRIDWRVLFEIVAHALENSESDS